MAGTGHVNCLVPLNNLPPTPFCWKGGCSTPAAPLKQQEWVGGKPDPEGCWVGDGCAEVKQCCSHPTSCLGQAQDLAEPWWLQSLRQDCGHTGDGFAATCVARRLKGGLQRRVGRVLSGTTPFLNEQEAPFWLELDLPVLTEPGLLTQRVVLEQRHPEGSHG